MATNMYLIALDGCDDSTLVMLRLTDSEAATAQIIATAVNLRVCGGCMPTMDVYKVIKEGAPSYDEIAAQNEDKYQIQMSLDSLRWGEEGGGWELEQLTDAASPSMRQSDG